MAEDPPTLEAGFQARIIESRIRRAMEAWHVDRKEWADRAMRSLMLVNAGGAVAVAAYMGAARSTGVVPSLLIISFLIFTLGLTFALGYGVYRFLWAEYRIWYLRDMRARSRARPGVLGLKQIKTQLPPTRPQLWATYGCNILSFLLFIAGVVLGVIALASSAPQ